VTVDEVQQKQKPHAVGVRLGGKSGNLMTIDFDGLGSEAKFKEVFGRSSAGLPRPIA